MPLNKQEQEKINSFLLKIKIKKISFLLIRNDFCLNRHLFDYLRSEISSSELFYTKNRPGGLNFLCFRLIIFSISFYNINLSYSDSEILNLPHGTI